MENYRMVSWWLRKDALPWPNEALQDQFRRRADQLAKAGANSAIIFGAHFRWDFCRVWEPLHALIRFVADELHSRNIILFDHHSSVLTCYYNRDPERFEHTYSNHRQVLISPPASAPLPENELDDWKMIDVMTGFPAFLPQYGAQEFCMNNLDFAAAYANYVRRLVADTGIDGLMSDDAVFYPRFRSCGCRHCRQRFFREYGHVLPPVDNLDFWGNWKNSAWRNWVQMRFQTTQDFFARITAAVPPGMRLMSCCSGCATLVRMLPLCHISISLPEGPILSCWKCVVIHPEQTARSTRNWLPRQICSALPARTICPVSDWVMASQKMRPAASGLSINF